MKNFYVLIANLFAPKTLMVDERLLTILKPFEVGFLCIDRRLTPEQRKQLGVWLEKEELLHKRFFVLENCGSVIVTRVSAQSLEDA